MHQRWRIFSKRRTLFPAREFSEENVVDLKEKDFSVTFRFSRVFQRTFPSEESMVESECCKSEDERLCNFSRTIWRILDVGCSSAELGTIDRFKIIDERELLIISFSSLTVFFNWAFSKRNASTWNEKKIHKTPWIWRRSFFFVFF